MSHTSEAVGAATRSLHADDVLNVVTDVAPPLHLSTTFRYSENPEDLMPAADASSVWIDVLSCSLAPFLMAKTNVVRNPQAYLSHLLPVHRTQFHPL